MESPIRKYDVRSVRHAGAAVLGVAAFLSSINVAYADGTAYATNMPIDVVLTASIDSVSARVGDTFHFKTISDVRLGPVEVPAGTPGSGRLAKATPATRSSIGELALQADRLVSVSGTTIWVNVDTGFTPRAELTASHDIVLNPGMAFRVMTIVPRAAMPPLVDTSMMTPAPINDSLWTTANATTRSRRAELLWMMPATKKWP